METTAAANGEQSQPPKRQRWGPPPSTAQPTEKKRKRKSRWESDDAAAATSTALTVTTSSGTAIITHIPKEVVLTGGIVVAMPSVLTGRPTHSDPAIQKLYDELEEISNRIDANDLRIPPEDQRSPSPEPVYDRNGIRQNTREVRVKAKMQEERHKVIEELIKADPAFKPPPDYRPAKKSRKLYIPYREYPGYNFIGLIIGPRGNTQKRMQKETNTRIAIRGRGSVKDQLYDYGEDDDLHVLIQGDTEEDVENAAQLIKELLTPVDEDTGGVKNEHKRLQLRELASINGTLQDGAYCYLCGQTGHVTAECPNKGSTDLYQLPDHIREKVEAQYARDVARMNPGEAGKMDEEYHSFLQELGGGSVPEGIRAPTRLGLGLHRSNRDLPDDCKLYVGNLPNEMDDARLRELFTPFGTIVHCMVMKDATTGLSRGFGFVHYASHDMARTACDTMNRQTVDGRVLSINLRSEQPPPGQRLGVNPSRPDVGVPEDCKIYIALLPPAMEDADLERLFTGYGQVLYARVIKDRVTGNSKCYGFVGMANAEQTSHAIAALHGYRLGERAIVVKRQGDRSNDPPPPPPVPTAGYGAPMPHYGAPVYPGAPPPPPPYGYAAPPPYGWGAAPPGYGMPPPGHPYMNAPPPPPAYAPPAYAGYNAVPPPPPENGAPPPPPGEDAAAPPPPPPEAAAPPPPAAIQNEYERFMSEMQTF